MTSKRRSRPAAAGWRGEPQRRRRGRCAGAPAAVTASAASARFGRCLTSTKASSAAAPGDQVDLADRRAVAAGEDAVALEAQEPGGQRLGAAAAALGLRRAARSGGAIAVLQGERPLVEVAALEAGERRRLGDRLAERPVAEQLGEQPVGILVEGASAGGGPTRTTISPLRRVLRGDRLRRARRACRRARSRRPW